MAVSQQQPVSPFRGQPQQAPPQMDSVVLGLQQLERQQAQQERKRQAKAALLSSTQDSSDDSTAPSTTQNSNTNDALDPGPSDEKESSIGRFITNTRVSSIARLLSCPRLDLVSCSRFKYFQKRLSSRDLKASANEKSIVEPVTHAVYGDVPEISEMIQYEGGNLLICGYLHKLGRNGKWQKRFFETDGENLTYYKTSARAKCLATLDLLKVGDICVDSEDPDGCTLIIQVADRPYRLRADSQSSCRDWVITLNRVKEARMHVGRMQLVRPAFSADKEDGARVVLEANRQRTKAVDGDNIHSWEDIIMAENEAAKEQEMELALSAHATRLGTASKRIQEAAVARWQKRQPSVQRLTSRLIVWARSIKIRKRTGCTDVEDQVVLDHHVHPPGHDHRPSVRFFCSKYFHFVVAVLSTNIAFFFRQFELGGSKTVNRSTESSVVSQNIGPSVTTTTRGSRDEVEEEETREIS